MRLIDADALMAKAYIMQEPNGFIRSAVTERQIAKALTIDAVPVVRCKDCKHLNILNGKELYAHCSKTNMVFPPFEVDTRDHFCSYGERKDGEG